MPDSILSSIPDPGIAESAKSPRTGLGKVDLVTGLTPEQIQWLLANLNRKALYDALRRLPDLVVSPSPSDTSAALDQQIEAPSACAVDGSLELPSVAALAHLTEFNVEAGAA
jgi:hypothetical protein